MLRLTALISVALVACVNTGDEGIYVINNTAVTGTTCALSGSPDQAQLGHGLINWSSPLPYVLTPLIQSRFTSTTGSGSNNTGDDFSRTVQLRGANVHLTLAAQSIETSTGITTTNPNATIGDDFSVLFSGSIAPGASLNAFVDIIPISTLRMLAYGSGANLDTDTFSAEVVASVVIKGDVNGDSIESAPFVFPVTVCNNCVVNMIGDCPVTVTPRAGNACNPFQDGVVDCCRESTGVASCPARTL